MSSPWPDWPSRGACAFSARAMIRTSDRLHGRGPCSDRVCRLLAYRQAGKVTAKIAPRTCVNVLQSTSTSELPEARHAPREHPPRTRVSVLQSTSVSELLEARLAPREHPPRTCVSVLQSTSASELPKARFAPCGHAPRRDSPGTGLKG